MYQKPSREEPFVTDYRDMPEQCFEFIANFRDLGGHTTRDGRRVARGRLLRSGHLGRASDSDLALLADLGLRRVFDFRTSGDIKAEGADRLPEQTESVLLAMPDPAQGGGIRELMEHSGPEQLELIFGEGRAEKMMAAAAAGLVRERREPFARFLKALAETQTVPALFHCSAGKDRAGWAGSVALLTLGVPEDQVIEQYLLSNRATEAIIDQARARGHVLGHSVLNPIVTVRREYIEASFDAIRKDWGDFDTYLHRGLGISSAERESIRENLLE